MCSWGIRQLSATRWELRSAPAPVKGLPFPITRPPFLLFKHCTASLGVNQNISLYNGVPSCLFWGLPNANDWKKPGKYGKQEKGLWWSTTLMCLHSAFCRYSPSAAPAWRNIKCVSLCPGIQEVQPHHQRHSIPSDNEVLRQCNGKRENRRGDGKDDFNWISGSL